MAITQELKDTIDALSALDRADASKYCITARDGNAGHALNNKYKWQVLTYILGWRDDTNNPIVAQKLADAFVGMYGLTDSAGKWITNNDGEQEWQPWDINNLTPSQSGIEAIRRTLYYVKDIRRAWKIKQEVDAARVQAEADADADLGDTTE